MHYSKIIFAKQVKTTYYIISSCFLKILADSSIIQTIELKKKINASSKQFQKALSQLKKEGFVTVNNEIIDIKQK